MKKILILFAGLFSSIILLGQPIERTVGNLPIISEVKASLELATGYSFQDNGEWISAQNRIPYKVADLIKVKRSFTNLAVIISNCLNFVT